MFKIVNILNIVGYFKFKDVLKQYKGTKKINNNMLIRANKTKLRFGIVKESFFPYFDIFTCWVRLLIWI